MFLIDTQNKKAISLAKSTFSELKLSERYDLQEWIVGNPRILGENLLIIQKEFDGFSDTNERLDLLALDESGKLVIIENKLDDSGKDVVWQALKYVSYCATLTKSEICEIYHAILEQRALLQKRFPSFMTSKTTRTYASIQRRESSGFSSLQRISERK
jgi:RecB family endonuclease NucS